MDDKVTFLSKLFLNEQQAHADSIIYVFAEKMLSVDITKF